MLFSDEFRFFTAFVLEVLPNEYVLPCIEMSRLVLRVGCDVLFCLCVILCVRVLLRSRIITVCR